MTDKTEAPPLRRIKTLEYRGMRLPADLQLPPEMIRDLVARVLRTMAKELDVPEGPAPSLQAARLWMVRGYLGGRKSLKRPERAKPDASPPRVESAGWVTTWGELVEAMRENRIPPMRILMSKAGFKVGAETPPG